jgi:MCM P-loop domain
MSKVGADDFATATGATAENFDNLPRAEIGPTIHLVDLELTKHIGHIVQTDIVIAGVGETFHVPESWEVQCNNEECEVCPKTINLKRRRELLTFCRMSDAQKMGFMRVLSGCSHKPKVKGKLMTTVTELLALPMASPTVEKPSRDYREKIIALLGSLPHSNIRYHATGLVIAEPTRQKASLLVSRLDRLKSAADGFELTPVLRDRFRVFQMREHENFSPQALLDAAETHVERLVHDITLQITKIYGQHREKILLGQLLVMHSPAEIPWEGEIIKGVIDGLIIGDTGQGKTTQARRLIEATNLGHLATGSTASRTGILYNLDSKVNDKRILRWGAFPLAHGEVLFIDEAQNIPRTQWCEFTTARSEGILRIDRSVRAEHPSRVRLVCFANPVNQRSMASFQYGIMAVHPESGFLDPQDLRRFDFVACVAEADDTKSHTFSATPGQDGTRLIMSNDLRESILWAWTRRVEHLQYAPGAECAIRSMANALNKTFGTPEIPLLIADAHEKVARIAFGFAALLHSTDASHEKLIVTPIHVGLVGRFLEALYTHQNCAFDQYAIVLRKRTCLGEDEYDEIVGDLLTRGSNREDTAGTEAMLEIFLTEEEITKPDLEAATGLGKDALSRRIGKLRKHRLIQSGKRGYRKTPRFVAFLRKWDETRSNPSNHTAEESVGGVSQ